MIPDRWRALGFGLCMAAGLSAYADSVVTINEFMAANAKTLRDQNQEYSDWIELYNAGPDPANLGGWTLTDTVGNPTRWTFPATNLNANAYLLVFVSGKNRAVAGQQLHTSFNLSADGEYLALVSPEGEVATEFAPVFPKQFTDVSYGFRQGRQYYFPRPTPGTPNLEGYNDFVADTKFSQDRGFYTQPFELTLTTATAEAIVLYTTNGSAPTLTATATNGTVHTTPIRIGGTTIVRAAAFKSGFQPSNVDTHSYVFLDDVIRQSTTGAAPGAGWPAPGRMSTGQSMDYGMDPDVVNNPKYSGTMKEDLKTLPSFSVVMDLPDLFSPSTGIYANPGQDTRAWERKCSVELIDPQGNAGFQIDCGIRIRGGFSRSGDNPKHAFRLFFREVYGAPKLRYPLFRNGGAEEFDCLDLRTFQNYSWSFQGDSRGVFLRDQFSRDTQVAMGQAAERGEFCHLYLNGQYWGLFNTCERPEASYGETYFGGSKDDYDVIKVAPDNGYTILATDGNLTAWTKLYNLCRQGLTNDAACERILGNNPDGTRNPAYDKLIDGDNLIDYMLVILWGGNLDAPISNFLGNNSPNNFYGFRNRLGSDGFRFVAHDSEHTLLNVNEDRTGPFAAGNNAVSASNPQWVWQKMWANPEFRVQTGDRIHRHFFNDGVLTRAAAEARFRARQAEIDRAVVAESARWGDAKRATPFTRDNWLAEANNILNNFIPQRAQVVLNQLKARNLYPAVVAPAFNQHGGAIPAGLALTASAPAGTIYYTLDGSDPRLRGGSVAPAALTYTKALAVSESLAVKSRALVGTNWSALNAAEFVVIQTYTNLAVTEIMYHPPAGEDVDEDDYEFIELKNLNPFPIDVSGVHFTDGIQYTFPLGRKLTPGEIVVLARDPVRFAERYPGVPVAGTYEGNLANGGERLALAHATGTPLWSMSYGDAPPWPGAADGQGFSLAPALPNVAADPDDPRRWRASSRTGGSPGADDPPVDLPPVVINEVLTHTDLPQVDTIELYNPTDVPADVSGWFLTDDRTVPAKYRIPPGTRLEARGYARFVEPQFNGTAGVDPSFTLSSHGEEIFLFSAEAAGALTGYSDGFSFGAAANGVTFGRHTNSVGEVQFPAQRASTLGAANAGPAVGPVVINEVQYQPAAGDPEFVELKNLTDAPVKLYDAFHPTNTWRLAGLDFDFPAYLELAPRGLLLVVASDPAQFRAHYGVPARIPVLGPFPGVLQNSGERLELQRPDAPDLETNRLGEVRVVVPYITVDAIRYNDKPPWPTNAAGLGSSLERLRAELYGDDPANWRASFGPPSPGLENDGNRAPIARAGADQEVQVSLFPAPVTIAGSATDDGRPNPAAGLQARWTQLSGPGQVLFARADQLATTLFVPGIGDYVVRLTVGDGELEAHDDLAVTVRRPAAQQVLLPAGSEWRYLDDGSDQKTNWVAPGFDDSAWKKGKAQLGYSSTSPENDEITTLSYGSSVGSKHITYYFRTQFTLADPAAVTVLTAKLLRDDGAVVYLNGWPAYRENMPEIDLNYQSLASTAAAGADESTFFEHAMDPARLRAGANVLAIEIHQNSASSTDLSFDFQLEALAFPANRPPTVSAGADVGATCGEWTRLNGSFADDGLPSPPGAPVVAWSKVSGPAEVELATPEVWQAAARFPQLGDYVLRLTVNDGNASVSDDVVVSVVRKPAPVPAWEAVALPGGAGRGVRLRWLAEAGWTYRVEFSDALPAGGWERLTETTKAATARLIEIEDTVPSDRPSRYYRLSRVPD